MSLSTETYDKQEIETLQLNILSSLIYYLPESLKIIELEQISPNWFTDPIAKQIFSGILTSDSNPGTLDPLIVFDDLKKSIKKKEILDKCAAYLENLKKDVQYYNIKKYLSFLSQRYIKQKLDDLCKKVITTQLSDKNFNDQIETWDSEFNNIILQDKSLSYITAEEAVEDYEKQIDNNDKNKAFLKSEYSNLDKKIKGFRPGEFVVIASRPGVGKTTFALNLINNNLPKIEKTGEKKQCSIGIFSLEMLNKSLVEKMIAIHSKIDLQNLQRWSEGGALEEHDVEMVNYSKKIIKSSSLLFCDEVNITIWKMIATIKMWSRQFDLKMVIIDYLQLINFPQEMENNNFGQYQKIGIISRQLKILAIDLNICIVALAQLNRKFEDRKTGDKTPILSDLRESGSIEQDADIVLFLYPQISAEAILQNQSTKENSSSSKLALKIGKNRHGQIGNVVFDFEKNYGIFTPSSEGI